MTAADRRSPRTPAGSRAQGPGLGPTPGHQPGFRQETAARHAPEPRQASTAGPAPRAHPAPGTQSAPGAEQQAGTQSVPGAQFMPCAQSAPGTQSAPGEQSPLDALDPAVAAAVAETMQALSAPSRLLILARLRRAPCSVSTLVTDVGMTQSAVSHQLRLLRQLGLVTATRQGKMTIYSLYDEHVAMLLDAAVGHSARLR